MFWNVGLDDGRALFEGFDDERFAGDGLVDQSALSGGQLTNFLLGLLFLPNGKCGRGEGKHKRKSSGNRNSEFCPEFHKCFRLLNLVIQRPRETVQSIAKTGFAAAGGPAKRICHKHIVNLGKPPLNSYDFVGREL